MPQFRIFTVSLLLFIFCTQAGDHTNAQVPQAEWAAYLNEQLEEAMSLHQLPNASLAIVANGELIYLQGYGHPDVESSERTDPALHLFRPGSISKVFTWTAIMQLAEKGLVDLDADINRYLDFELPGHLHGHKKGPAPAPITLNHLMTHTSGFEDLLDGLFVLDENLYPGLRDYLTQKVPARIYPPGEVMAYSNYGPALAGYIIERVSGKSFVDYMEEQVFQVLGMHHSSFRQPLPQSLRSNLVTPYRKVEGEFLPGRFEYMPAPAGGLSTTAADMALFMLAHLEPDDEHAPRLLQPQTLRQMHSALFTHHPLLGGMAHGFMEGTINKQRVVFHGGSTTLFDAGLYLLPESRAGVFIAYSGGSFVAHTEIFHAFMDWAFPFPEDLQPVMPEGLTVMPEALTSSMTSAPRGEYQQSRRVETSSGKLINILSGVLRISKGDKDRQIRVSYLGKTYRFEEKAGGIYRNLDPGPASPFGAFQYLVTGRDPWGRDMLMTDGPMTYIQMPFHAQAGAFLVILPGALLFSLGILLFRLIRWVAGRFSRSPAATNQQTRTARWLSTLHAAMLVFMVVLLAGNGAPHPVYQLPLSAFGETSAAGTMLGFLPYVVSLLGAMLILVAAQATIRKDWSGKFRWVLVVQGVFAVGLIWLFWHYNLFNWS
jgi:CubicO group peptidase (beta-lactamase class C family)